MALRFLSSSVSSLATKVEPYTVVIVGAGSGGLSVAHPLSEALAGDKIALVEPLHVHYNQPLWTFVGGGLKHFSKSVTPIECLVPSKVDLVSTSVLGVDPVAKVVHTTNGRILGYEYLVLAPGIECLWGSVKGLTPALIDPSVPVTSNYHHEFVKKTAPAFKSLIKGTALFTMPATPIKCAGAPQKIAYIAEEYWRENGIRSNIDVSYYTGGPKIFVIPKYETELMQICKSRNIHTQFLHDLVAVDAHKSVATFRILPTPGVFATADTNHMDVPFDFLHVTPPMGPPSWVNGSGLGNETGFVSVDPGTLQHTQYPTIFSLGDASSCPTSKTAAAVASQSPVLVSNLISHMTDRPLVAIYDGYSSCPLLTGRNKVILAEFSGYTGFTQETLPFNQAEESGFSYWLTAHLLPFIYWYGFVSGGWWKGPSRIRAILNSWAKSKIEIAHE